MYEKPYPLIGNYGVCLKDMESERPWPDALIMRELARVPSNFRSGMSLTHFIRKTAYRASRGLTRGL